MKAEPIETIEISLDKKRALKQLRLLGFTFDDSTSSATAVYAPDGVLLGRFTFHGKKAGDAGMGLRRAFNVWRRGRATGPVRSQNPKPPQA